MNCSQLFGGGRRGRGRAAPGLVAARWVARGGGGPPVEAIKLDGEIDATDQLELPDQNRGATQAGIFPQLAALESIIYPTVAQLQAEINLAQTGVLEVAPTEAPLAL